ncbi:MAG: hypothetical protein ACE361_07625 [Aureliella sp.]
MTRQFSERQDEIEQDQIIVDATSLELNAYDGEHNPNGAESRRYQVPRKLARPRPAKVMDIEPWIAISKHCQYPDDGSTIAGLKIARDSSLSRAKRLAPRRWAAPRNGVLCDQLADLQSPLKRRRYV